MSQEAQTYTRPAFLDALSNAYSERGKGVVILTGNTHDRYWCDSKSKFVDLDRSLYNALLSKFTVLRLDISTGIGFYSQDDLTALSKVCAKADSLTLVEREKIGDLKELIPLTEQKPLPALLFLHKILESVTSVRRTASDVKPVCTIVKFSGSLFPAGDFSGLGELDRQRLVTFLTMIESPWFRSGDHLVILVADTTTEVNSKVAALPLVQSVQIELPNDIEREKFAREFIAQKADAPIDFEVGLDEFVTDTAGLTMTAVGDLLEVGRRSKTKIGRKDVLSEINVVMQADLGDIIKISKPEHGRSDIIRFEEVVRLLFDSFKRCENPKTAIPAILVSGPNGSGKSYLLEACAADSGRVVIELANLRGMYFGQTDTFFEKLLLRIKSYGKILILVDEAHTAFGSVHSNDTHETEKRLAGNVIKMMSNKALYGKVLWALMTSRPDELDPDVKSRASSVQIPILDLEGEERKLFVTELFTRQNIKIPDDEIEEVLKRTANYSNRNYDFLLREVLGSQSGSVLETLNVWRASISILKERRLQTLIAAQHCTYPSLLPADLSAMVDSDEVEDEIKRLKVALHLA